MHGHLQPSVVCTIALSPALGRHKRNSHWRLSARERPGVAALNWRCTIECLMAEVVPFCTALCFPLRQPGKTSDCDENPEQFRCSGVHHHSHLTRLAENHVQRCNKRRKLVREANSARRLAHSPVCSATVDPLVLTKLTRRRQDGAF